uniref:lactate racemase domain-containing protein n=1 Tax=Ndongobacter massiliensis TaxID=1871025 RepID=UPI000AE5C0FA|nr:lactate racemase domain-containing protein [Ndongobacter massiliensis]
MYQSRCPIEEIPMYRIRQQFPTDSIADVRAETLSKLRKFGLQDRVKPGMTLAITAGSRGISKIDVILRAVCDFLKEAGAKPFIVPAMGSHGGATNEGQLHVLHELGITEKTMDVPICASMECELLGHTENGMPVYFDKIAYEADGVIVVNRIKPHTDFVGTIESGLTKMMAIGLGNELGCSTMHAWGLGKSIPVSARLSKQKVNIVCGLGILENSRDETYRLEPVSPEHFEEEEHVLLEEAKRLVPRLPVEELDVLVVNEMGKMFSGTGMDTKIIGRMRVPGEKEPESPRIKQLAVLNLASNSYGNALGIGLADVTTQKLADAVDWKATYANIIPTTYLERGKLPVTLPNDQQAITIALNGAHAIDPHKVRLAVVKNTLQLQEMWVSEAVRAELAPGKAEVLEETRLSFDEMGNLCLGKESL